MLLKLLLVLKGFQVLAGVGVGSPRVGAALMLAFIVQKKKPFLLWTWERNSFIVHSFIYSFILHSFPYSLFLCDEDSPRPCLSRKYSGNKVERFLSSWSSESSRKTLTY